MKKAHFITPAIAAFFLATSCASDKDQIETPSDNTNLEGYSLIWQDEFNEMRSTRPTGILRPEMERIMGCQ
jgi:hypothetical protein